MAEAFSHPGADPRQWFSYGIVDGMNDDDPEPSVVFNEDFGPLVKVTLQPSMVPAYCRVSGTVAGNGEGEYHPFIEGDEVLVLIPEGDERGDCVIIGRMNNSIDKFPMDSVAGQDPTTNTFGFKRVRTPQIDEFAGPYTMRSALTGALLAFDEGGGLTVRDGEGAGFQISADVIGLMDASGEYLMQLDLTNKHALLQAGDAILSLSATGANPEQNMLNTPGPLAINTSGNAAGEHAISTEAVANILSQMLLVLGPLFVPPIAPIAIPGMVAAWFATAAAAPINPIVLAAVTGAFVLQPQKVVVPPGGQPIPGIGCPGTFIG